MISVRKAPGPPTDPIPIVDFAKVGRFGVVRCRRCRAYVNPFFQFTNGGRKMVCNVCHSQNDVPPAQTAAAVDGDC